MPSAELQIILGSEGSSAGCDLGALWLGTLGRGEGRGPERM